MALAAGLRAFVRIIVAETDTAVAMGSGDVPVLGTPRLLALAEAAATAAIRPSLEPGQTSVGTSAVMEHNRPSPVGAEVVVEPAEGATRVTIEQRQKLRGQMRFGGLFLRRATRKRLDEALDGLERACG